MSSPQASRPAPLRASWLLAGAAGLGSAAAAHRGPVLADPHGCPGLVDATLVGLSRLWPEASIGALLQQSHDAMAVVAAIVFWWLAYHLVSRRLVATGLTLGFALTPAFAFVLAPTPLAAMAASTWFLLIAARAGSDASFGTAIRATVALAGLAACVPPLALAATLAASGHVWLAWPRRSSALRLGASALAGASVALVAAIVAGLQPGLPPILGNGTAGPLGCLVPAWAAGTSSQWRTWLPLLGAGGALVVALAMLGAFVSRVHMLNARVFPSAVLGVGSLMAAAAAGASTPGEALTPLLTIGWALAAIGLGDIARAATGRRARPLAAGIVVFAIPALSFSASFRTAHDPDSIPLGHDSLSRQALGRLIAVLPPESALVREDAATDLLMRSLDGTWQRAGKDIALLSLDPAGILTALGNRAVFLLPRAQRSLQHRGVQLGEDLWPGVTGAARVRSVTACDMLQHDWRELAGLANASDIALAARHSTARGPVVIYLGSQSPLGPGPSGWPGHSVRGFFFQVFDAAVTDDRTRMAEERARDGAPDQAAAFGYPHVTRLELWRTPDAPLVLPVRLGSAAAVGRSLAESDGTQIEMCPAFPTVLKSFEPGS